MGMKSLKWEGIGTKNLFPHTSSSVCAPVLNAAAECLIWLSFRFLFPHLHVFVWTKCQRST